MDLMMLVADPAGAGDRIHSLQMATKFSNETAKDLCMTWNTVVAMVGTRDTAGLILGLAWF